ncbi:SusC/RagA family TonB-linked outer membrane protein [Hymenobacter cavernae]|uniref:SusC/RagA family TonB-linked outer membrane protein n=1 Tax=Hymenobacter cavernae TaxID=2044852 RepID=A0ABQ1UBH1_9BACT|nr:SusC/RagA family TonB-linked outer membrane protein [Hymenobacter cavernae]GGF14059.1 SusC/RagA family TonB-linked outer membrane protein [Hymenobacter cavernae]
MAGSNYVLAQTSPTQAPIVAPATNAPAPASTPGTPPELAKPPIPTVFTASVTDENGEPLTGVHLANESGSIAAVTDSVGQAEMPGINAGETLLLSVENSVVRRFVAGADQKPIIALDTKNAAVARLKPVRLLFNTSIRPDLTAASTQSIYYRDLQKFPVTTFLNALAGQAAGVQAIQLSGRPSDDFSVVSVLGWNPTIVIDGIARSSSSLDPVTSFDLEEIESVTVLKDALSTAMLGVRNTNGGILNVTTRRGTPGQPRISFTVQSATQQPLKFPKALDAYDYATLYNEARVNDGLAPVYTQADLALYQNGQDPIGHPNVNWRDQVLKKSSQLNRYTFSASGGNQFSKYFVSLEHLSQSGLLQTSDINKYNTSNDYKAYTVRSNIDLQLSKKLTGGIRLLGRILNGNDAGSTTTTILSSLLNTPANAYPVFNTNGSYGGTQQFQNNLYAQTVGSGYRQNYKRNVIADFYLQRSLDELTPGLFVRGTGSYYASLSENIARNKTFATFLQTTPATGNPTYQQFGTNGDQANGNSISYQSNTTYLEAALGYNRQFAAHGLNAIVVGSRQSANTDSDLPYTVTGLSGRFSYNYQQKYVAELAFGLNGSNRYPDNGSTKYGFFPAAGLAWNISRESFLESQKWLSFLKLYTSIGLTGNDNPGYFSYIQTYFDTPAVYFGTGAGTQSANTEQVLATIDRTWEKARKLTLGVQGAVLDNHLGFTLEYYNSLYYDMLQQRGRSTTLLGQLYPDENIGRYHFYGVTGQLTYQQSFGNLGLFATANIGVQNSRVLSIDEVYRPYEWMQRTGQPVGQSFGYVAEGLFQNAADVAGHATTVGYTPQPGDIKYKDLNGDGIIDQFDQAAIGSTKPSIPFGVTVGARWKGFDFSVLLQGVLNRQVYLQGNSEYAFQNNGFGGAFEQHLDRWTPSNPNATYPRVGLGNNLNNFATSSFWLHNNNYMRLKNVELGYTFPLNLSQRARVQGVRLFFNATNLLTFSQYDRIDPEVYNAAYPIQRLLNLGLNIKL